MSLRSRLLPVTGALFMAAGIALAACAGPATPAPTEAPAMEPTMQMEPEHEEEGTPAMDMGEGEMEEHAHAEVPAVYEGLTNPYAGDEAAVTEGKQIYDGRCATCHGSSGAGDGPAASALTPPPAAFTDADMMQSTTDGYLFWRVSEGGAGEPFNSAMPGWKATMTQDEIWQVISYVRTFGGN